MVVSVRLWTVCTGAGSRIGQLTSRSSPYARSPARGSVSVRTAVPGTLLSLVSNTPRPMFSLLSFFILQGISCTEDYDMNKTMGEPVASGSEASCPAALNSLIGRSIEMAQSAVSHAFDVRAYDGARELTDQLQVLYCSGRLGAGKQVRGNICPWCTNAACHSIKVELG